MLRVVYEPVDTDVYPQYQVRKRGNLPTTPRHITSLDLSSAGFRSLRSYGRPEGPVSISSYEDLDSKYECPEGVLDRKRSWTASISVLKGF
jgi:hypothetical protein